MLAFQHQWPCFRSQAGISRSLVTSTCKGQKASDFIPAAKSFSAGGSMTEAELRAGEQVDTASSAHRRVIGDSSSTADVHFRPGLLLLVVCSHPKTDCARYLPKVRCLSASSFDLSLFCPAQAHSQTHQVGGVRWRN